MQSSQPFQSLRSALLLGALLSVAAAPNQEYSELSPFSGVRWKESVPQVQVDGTWYELIALNDLSSEKIVSFCKESYGKNWKKRFGEDLVRALTEMGHEPGTTADLELRGVESGDKAVMKDVPMTEENRRAIVLARRLEKRRKSSEERKSIKISRQQAEEDLVEFRRILEERYSYLEWKGVDYEAALEELRSSLKDEVTGQSLALGLQTILCLFGDGHSRIAGFPGGALPRGYLPFLVGDHDGRLFAFEADRSDFFDPEHPHLVSIDGLEMKDWLQAAGKTVARGSPQLVRSRSIRRLRYIQHLRQEMGLKQIDSLRLVLESEDGEKIRRTEVPIAPDRRPAYGPWPRTNHQVLPGEIGYLRIPTMESGQSFLSSLKRAMVRFKETKGLIIDVRGNGGGSRDVLRTLLPYFMSRDDPPHVVNVAAYRLPRAAEAGAKEGYMENRFLYPVTAGVWSKEEKSVVGKFARTFKPQWRLPGKGFSQWHLMAISRTDDDDVFHYDRPVVVLQDEGCFSATDIFLGAFKGRRGVTLMGVPSSGGSARVKGFKLTNSEIEFSLASMASFQPSGKMYDGNGIQPDVLMKPVPSDWLGRTDTLLDGAHKSVTNR